MPVSPYSYLLMVASDRPRRSAKDACESRRRRRARDRYAPSLLMARNARKGEDGRVYFIRVSNEPLWDLKGL